MKAKHTNGEWLVIKHHPVFENSILIMSELVESDKSFKKGKLICEFNDIRGDSFTRLENEEVAANVQLIAAAPETLRVNVNVKHYAEQALKSLDNGSLSEVRGLLEGIVRKTTTMINIQTS